MMGSVSHDRGTIAGANLAAVDSGTNASNELYHLHREQIFQMALENGSYRVMEPDENEEAVENMDSSYNSGSLAEE